MSRLSAAPAPVEFAQIVQWFCGGRRAAGGIKMSAGKGSDQFRQHEKGRNDQNQADGEHDQHRAAEESLPRFGRVEHRTTGPSSPHDETSDPLVKANAKGDEPVPHRAGSEGLR